MKKINLLLVVIISVFTFSCSEVEPVDPILAGQVNQNNGNNGGGSATASGVVGMYLMTAFNSSVAVDLDGNGSSSTNLMDETNCLDGNFLLINANNTFTSNANGVDIEFDGTNEIITCYQDPVFGGSWSLNGNLITFTYTDAGTQYTDEYLVSGNTIKIIIPDGEVVGTANGNPVYLDSNLEIIYTKQ